MSRPLKNPEQEAPLGYQETDKHTEALPWGGHLALISAMLMEDIHLSKILSPDFCESAGSQAAKGSQLTQEVSAFSFLIFPPASIPLVLGE